jgi:hypothetical protein
MRGVVKGFVALALATPKVLIEHPFPRQGVDGGGLRDYAVHVKNDGVKVLRSLRNRHGAVLLWIRAIRFVSHRQGHSGGE